ncbi:hypothetical protein ABE354_23400 [Brevibacillus laterosporus]|uniref:hypothetical protein n=1 Tax=Brevibacillus laterosporus TaxID=1465 RepID=UPI003D1AC802
MSTVIQNVRQESAAGWYVGSLEFLDDNVVCWDKETGYFPSEGLLKNHYPYSISMQEAYKKAKQHNWINSNRMK